MDKPNNNRRPRLQDTVDSFVSSVPWDKRRTVLVHRTKHKGRLYIRFRTWNRHKKLHVWYPTKRFYVIPVAEAEALAEAIKAAAQNAPLAKKPKWYAAREMADRERADRERYEESLYAGAPDAIVKLHRRAMKTRKRGWV